MVTVTWLDIEPPSGLYRCLESQGLSQRPQSGRFCAYLTDLHRNMGGMVDSTLDIAAFIPHRSTYVCWQFTNYTYGSLLTVCYLHELFFSTLISGPRGSHCFAERQKGCECPAN